MRKIFEKAEWMDFETRFRALEKLDSMRLIPAYPAPLASADVIADMFQDLELQVRFLIFVLMAPPD